MYIYTTSKNDQPSSGLRLVYLGPSVGEAEKAVPEKWQNHQKEEDHFPARRLVYSALPEDVEREMIQFYMWDGWWYSIERIDIPVTEDQKTIDHLKRFAERAPRYPKQQTTFPPSMKE